MQPHPDHLPPYLAAAFSVTWQWKKLDQVKAQIAKDEEPDFQFWYAADTYDPLGMNRICYYGGSNPVIDDFYLPDADHTLCMALQIDLLRPQADLLELRYPRAPHSFMLDVSPIAKENLEKCPENDANWIAFSSTTSNDAPASARRQTLFFPDVTEFNTARGTSFDNIIPNWNFAHAYENWLNSKGVALMEYRFYDDTIDRPAYFPPDIDVEDTIFVDQSHTG